MAPELHETRMGQTFLQGTAPQIARALERIAEAQEEANKLKKRELDMEEEKDKRRRGVIA